MKRAAGRGYQCLFYLLIIGVLLVNIKSIIIDADIDTEYAVAMSYRMLRGDVMFRNMWEPHQTSAFLCTFLMRIYHGITGDFKGVVIFLHGVGVLFQGIIALCLYRFLAEKLPRRLSVLMCAFFMIARPKGIVFPEFSNMQIWFQMLLFLFLLQYFESGKRRWVIAAGISLCLEVLAYPSCVLVWIPTVILIGIWGEKESRWKDIGSLTAVCVGCGILYVAFCVYQAGGWNDFWRTVQHIIAGDESHGIQKPLWDYMRKKNLLVSFVWITSSAVFSAGTYTLRRFVMKQKTQYMLHLVIWGMVLSCLVSLATWDRHLPAVMYLIVSILAVWGSKFCSPWEKLFVWCGLAISGTSVAATVLLSNLSFWDSMQYLVLAVMVAFLPCGRLLERFFVHKTEVARYGILTIFCLVILLYRGVIVKTFGGYCFFYNLGGIVKSGPAAGIISDYMGAYIINVTQTEWGQYVQDGDSVMLVGSDLVNTFYYLSADTEVGVPSTICTPTYNEKMIEYWNEYPEKYPDVVAVECWYGNLHVEEDEWVMKWLDSQYQAESVQDGSFWRFYRKKAL